METAHRRKAAMAMGTLPRYAGGGLVDKFKRAVGMAPPETMREKFAREDAERVVKQPKAPEPEKAITSYAAGSALEKRMKAADAMASGGPVKGPGTGTSDEVPILASNGEFVLRAAAVKAIGLPALTALNKLGGNVPEAPNTTDNKFEEGGPINGSTINKYGSEVANTPAQGAQLANQSAAYVAGAQAANPQPASAAVPAKPAPVSAPSGPLDAQAGADAKAFSGAWDTLKDVNSRVGASIADVATMVPRGLAGAYDTAVVRPMRAAGINAAYTSPMLSPAGADPASQTPFYDQIRKRDAAASMAAPSAPAAAPAAPTTTFASPNAEKMMQRQVGSAGSTAAPTTPTAQEQLAMTGRDVGGGITRYDQPGKSPLFSNVTNMADNAALMNRGQPSAQNQGAMDGIQRRQDIADGNRAIKAQYDQEVAAAQAVNQATADQAYAHKYGGRAMRDMMRVRNEQQQTANTARGQDLTAKTTQRGQDIQATDSNQRNSIARDRLSMDSKGAELDNASKSKMMAAQDKLAMAQTDEEVAAATKTLRALQGKYGKEAPAEQYAYAPGGQEIDPESKQLVTRPGVIFNKATGQTVQQGAKPAALPSKDKLVPGQTYQTPRGNAVWDGKQFTPV